MSGLSIKGRPAAKTRRRRHLPGLVLQGVVWVTVFCSMTFVFTTFLSTVSADSKEKAPKSQPAVVSSQGKPGVSSPPLATNSPASTSEKDTKSGPGSQQNKPQPLMTPKPSWTTMPLFTDPYNGASLYLAENPAAYGSGHIARMAKIPVAQWFGDWNADVQQDANAYVSAAATAGSVPVLVAYNIPNRDCGGYSVGGAGGTSIYTQWVRQFAAGIGSRPAVVILEPDALGALDCLPAPLQHERSEALSQAVNILKTTSKATVYIDAGTPVWQPKDVMASRLRAANIAAADGFSLNVSYFASTTQNQTYGDQLSSLIGYKHYVIDTSRNGGNHSVTGMQCNPSFASFGAAPTTNTGNGLNDALLWIKIPWESDGPCGGSPGPGQNYWSYALQLALNAGW